MIKFVKTKKANGEENPLIMTSAKGVKSVMISESKRTIDENGFFRDQVRTTWLKNIPEDLVSKITEGGDVNAFLKANYGVATARTIVRETSLTPFYEGQAEVANPTTGEAKGYYQNFKLGAVGTEDVIAHTTQVATQEAVVITDELLEEAH